MDDPNEQKVPFCICCGKGSSAKKGQLIYPCLCRRVSQLSCFHYKCLVRYIEGQLDKKCPQCRTTYEDPRIERYQIERYFSEFIWQFFFGPAPIDLGWTAHILLGFSSILVGLATQTSHPIFIWLIVGWSIVFFVLYLFTIWMLFDMYCEGWPHQGIRFHDFPAPNRIRIFDLTVAKQQADRQRVQEHHQELVDLALIELQDQQNNLQNEEPDIVEPEIDQVEDEYEDDDEEPDDFYVQ